MAKKISIELIIPDDTGNGETSLINKARDIFHSNFTGNPDYVDSNVVVHGNRNGSETFDETGLIIDFTRCKNKVVVANSLMNIFDEFIYLPEFEKMVHGNTDINAIIAKICMELKKGKNKYE